jgi:hypothetical protein
VRRSCSICAAASDDACWKQLLVLLLLLFLDAEMRLRQSMRSLQNRAPRPSP